MLELQQNYIDQNHCLVDVSKFYYVIGVIDVKFLIVLYCAAMCLYLHLSSYLLCSYYDLEDKAKVVIFTVSVPTR